MQRYAVLTASIVMQMCLGAIYSWSVFVQPLRDQTGLLQGPVQLPFTLFCITFPFMMIWAGSWLPKIGPRRSAIMGGILFGSGWLMAGFGYLHFMFTVIGIGLLSGIGVAFAYIVPIATCVRWFPNHKGLVTGAAVAGYGGGAALLSQIGGWFMSSKGLGPFETFQYLGGGFLAVVTLAALFIRNPPDAKYSAAAYLGWRNVLRQPAFRRLYLAMCCSLSAGFAVSANLKELVPDILMATGVTAVGTFALASATGRVFWGWSFDRFNGQTIVSINLFAQVFVLLFAPYILAMSNGLLLFAALSGFNYGGVLVLYASSVAQLWGITVMSQVYGLLFSANIPAAAAPMIAGFLFDAFGSFIPAFWSIAGIITIAAILHVRLIPVKGRLIDNGIL